MLRRFLSVAALVVLVFAVAGSGAAVLAQGATTPPPTLRAFTHIFLAYTAAWVLLLLWVLRIARKLKQATDL